MDNNQRPNIPVLLLMAEKAVAGFKFPKNKPAEVWDPVNEKLLTEALDCLLQCSEHYIEQTKRDLSPANYEADIEPTSIATLVMDDDEEDSEEFLRQTREEAEEYDDYIETALELTDAIQSMEWNGEYSGRIANLLITQTIILGRLVLLANDEDTEKHQHFFTTNIIALAKLNKAIASSLLDDFVEEATPLIRFSLHTTAENIIKKMSEHLVRPHTGIAVPTHPDADAPPKPGDRFILN